MSPSDFVPVDTGDPTFLVTIGQVYVDDRPVINHGVPRLAFRVRGKTKEDALDRLRARLQTLLGDE